MANDAASDLTLEQALREAGPYFTSGAPLTDADLLARLDHCGRLARQLGRASEREVLAQQWTDYFQEHTLLGIKNPWRVVRAAFTNSDSLPPAGPLPPPMGVRELLAVRDPEELYAVQGLIPVASNLLIAGYPKTHKTNFVLELAVAGAAGVPFLGRFPVPRQLTVGLCLMEDKEHRVRRRYERLCQGHSVTPRDLDGRVWFWFRPRLQLSSLATMAELAVYVREYALDVLIVDSWAYVATGNSDRADDVTPQLEALSKMRVPRPGLVVCLNHHARKVQKDQHSNRLTDQIRNSSAFGAWYDTGVVLSRSHETGPINVRAEMRDCPSPGPFAFTVEDEVPASPDTGTVPSGWLRLRVSEDGPSVLDREAAAAKMIPAVLEVLAQKPGCSKRTLRESVGGRHEVAEAAFELACRNEKARYEKPKKNGKAGRCWLIEDRARPSPDRAPDTVENTVPTVPSPPVGGRGGRGPMPLRAATVPPGAGHALEPEEEDAVPF